MTSRHLRLAVGAILFSISCAAMAENAVTTETASVRAGPDDSYPEVAQLDADSPIQVMGCLDDWSWCDVTFEGNRGWMYSPDITYEYEGGYVPFYTYAPCLLRSRCDVYCRFILGTLLPRSALVPGAGSVGASGGAAPAAAWAATAFGSAAA